MSSKGNRSNEGTVKEKKNGRKRKGTERTGTTQSVQGRGIQRHAVGSKAGKKKGRCGKQKRPEE